MELELFSDTLQVLERHKIRLTKDICVKVPFLAKKPQETVTAMAIPGRFGGIQIISDDNSMADLRRQIRELIQDGEASEDAAGKNWTLLARYVANIWSITFSFYDGRYTLVLPSAARELGLVPKNEGDNVLVFVCGEIFEIWRPEAWMSLTNNTGFKLDQLRDDLPDSKK